MRPPPYLLAILRGSREPESNRLFLGYGPSVNRFTPLHGQTEWTRTTDHYNPNVVRCQTALRSVVEDIALGKVTVSLSSMASSARLELAAFGFAARCSIQLNYEDLIAGYAFPALS